jgi:non-ribosomal peptide synthetase component F
MAAMVAAVVRAIKPLLEMPTIFFGHSLGSLVAYEVALEMQRQGMPMPWLLAASSQAAPAAAGEVAESDWVHQTADAEFVRTVGNTWGFIPEEALANHELLQVMLPALRADIGVWERYRPQLPVQRLGMPVLGVSGSDDVTAEAVAVASWATLTTAPYTAIEIAGAGHFHILTHTDVLLAGLKEAIAAVVAAAPLAVLMAPTNPAREHVFGKCLHTLFDEQAARTPDATAVVGLKRDLTYAQLQHEGTLLARELQRRGVAPEEPVGIYLCHCEEYIIANVAIFKAGGAMFLLETNYTPELLAEFLAAGKVKTVLTSASMVGGLPEGFDMDNVLLLDGPDWAAALEGAASGGTEAGGATGRSPLPAWTDPPVTPQSLAYFTMTSGSTGKPKAVMNTHLGAVVCFYGRFNLYPYAEGEREGLNVFFAWECFRAILKGVASVIIPDDCILNPKKLLTFIKKQRITRLLIPPSLMRAVLEYPGVDHRGFFAHMRYWIMEGEVLPMSTVNKFLQVTRGVGGGAALEVQLLNCYSSWEALDNTYANLSDPQFALANQVSKFASCGLPMPEVQVYILDEKMQFCKAEQPGFVYCATPAVFTGYMDDPKKTAEKLFQNPYAGVQHHPELGGGDGYRHSEKMYCTGDRGRFWPLGYPPPPPSTRPSSVPRNRVPPARWGGGRGAIGSSCFLWQGIAN